MSFPYIIRVRMRVLIGFGPARGPSRVPHAENAIFVSFRHEFLQLLNGILLFREIVREFRHGHVFLCVDGRHTCGIVASVR